MFPQSLSSKLVNHSAGATSTPETASPSVTSPSEDRKGQYFLTASMFIEQWALLRWRLNLLSWTVLRSSPSLYLVFVAYTLYLCVEIRYIYCVTIGCGHNAGPEVVNSLWH